MAEASGRPKEGFAMVPMSIVQSGLDNGCKVLYMYLTGKQGKAGWEMRGYNYVAEQLGWSDKSVSTHAGHLEEHGLVALTGSARPPHRRIVMRVIHNPSHGRVSHSVSLPPVKDRKKSESHAASRFGTCGPTPVPKNVPVDGASCTENFSSLKVESVPVDDPACGEGFSVHPRSQRCGGIGVGEEVEVVYGGGKPSGECQGCGGWTGLEAPPGAPFCHCKDPELRPPVDQVTALVGGSLEPDDVVDEF
jgi:hypothetical protein